MYKRSPAEGCWAHSIYLSFVLLLRFGVTFFCVVLSDDGMDVGLQREIRLVYKYEECALRANGAWMEYSIEVTVYMILGVGRCREVSIEGAHKALLFVLVMRPMHVYPWISKRRFRAKRVLTNNHCANEGEWDRIWHGILSEHFLIHSSKWLATLDRFTITSD